MHGWMDGVMHSIVDYLTTIYEQHRIENITSQPRQEIAFCFTQIQKNYDLSTGITEIICQQGAHQANRDHRLCKQ